MAGPLERLYIGTLGGVEDVLKICEYMVLPTFNSSKIVLKRKHVLKAKWLYWTGLFDTKIFETS